MKKNNLYEKILSLTLILFVYFSFSDLFYIQISNLNLFNFSLEKVNFDPYVSVKEISPNGDSPLEKVSSCASPDLNIEQNRSKLISPPLSGILPTILLISSLKSLEIPYFEYFSEINKG
jgi:hypothetical protein